MNNKVIIIYGPTAVGKSAIAIELAKQINGEIISADSMQIYKHLTIGTAKVTEDEMCGIKHHMIDFVEPGGEFSVAEFCEMAKKSVRDIQEKNKTPIIVGGTGLYIKALTEGYNFAEYGRNERFRECIESLSNDELYAKIIDINPEIKVDKNNKRRLVRTLEKLTFGGETKAQYCEFDYILFVIKDDRDKIYTRINNRVDKMVDLGILDELKYLLSLNLKEDDLCMKAIGYKEFLPYINGECSLKECEELLKQKTRNYAKRQFTFMNQFKDKICVEFDGIENTAKKIKEIIDNNGIA